MLAGGDDQRISYKWPIFDNCLMFIIYGGLQ